MIKERFPLAKGYPVFAKKSRARCHFNDMTLGGPAILFSIHGFAPPTLVGFAFDIKICLFYKIFMIDNTKQILSQGNSGTKDQALKHA